MGVKLLINVVPVFSPPRFHCTTSGLLHPVAVSVIVSVTQNVVLEAVIVGEAITSTVIGVATDKHPSLLHEAV